MDLSKLTLINSINLHADENGLQSFTEFANAIDKIYHEYVADNVILYNNVDSEWDNIIGSIDIYKDPLASNESYICVFNNLI